MDVETAERRFGFKFGEATKALRHQWQEGRACPCFPCRVYVQYNDVPDEKALGGKMKTAWEVVHDPESKEFAKIKKENPDAWVVWNNFLFWIY